MSSDSEMYQLLNKVFPIFESKLKAEPVVVEELERLHELLHRRQLLLFLYGDFFENIIRIVRHIVVPKFWSHFCEKSQDNTIPPSGRAAFLRFQNAIKELYEHFAFLRRQLKRLEIVCPAKELSYTERKQPNEVFEFCDQFYCILLAQLPANFNDLVYEFYSIAFRVFIYSHSESEEYLDVPEANHCLACDMSSPNCQCQAIADAFTSTNRYLSMMGILEEISGYTLNRLIQERIDAKVCETKENYSTSHVESLELWLNTVVMQWLTRIYNNGSLQIKPEHSYLQQNIVQTQNKLVFYMYEKYANMIVDQFFQIIINFPMSQSAVDDLKVCLNKINLDRCFVTTIREMLRSRLLHPGVDTPDILTGYVAALKTLAHFDSSAVLLRSITRPIKEYLRGRPETVRCVVTSFTGDGTSDLAEELAKSETVKPNVSNDDKTDDPDWRSWQPDPVNMAPAALKFITTNKPADIISMVVDIYGSKEIFVNEYRNLLAERLLSQVEFNPEKEDKYLELLKSRFGESMLHSCDVMLKDITQSKRINAFILSNREFDENDPFQVSALIVSSQFWPTFKKETMDLPDSVRNMFEKYTKAYESYKMNRTLQWTPLNGKVTIELEHNGKVQEMQVTPAQAAIAIHFGEQPKWELDRLGKKMNMPPIVLRKRLVFWQSQGLIREAEENVFVLIDKTTETHNPADQMQGQANDVCEEEEAESAMESASDQREEELQVFWSYIEAMLTNLDSLPLDRIHQMLKMFASQVDFTQDELKHILQRKVREHKLVYAGGVYQLPKP